MPNVVNTHQMYEASFKCGNGSFTQVFKLLLKKYSSKNGTPKNHIKYIPMYLPVQSSSTKIATKQETNFLWVIDKLRQMNSHWLKQAHKRNWVCFMIKSYYKHFQR